MDQSRIELWRRARAKVKEKIRAKGEKVTAYSPQEITAMARELIASGKVTLEEEGA